MSLKSGVLLSLFSGVSFADLQRAASRREALRAAATPTAADVAYATRFAGPAQVSTGTPAVAEANQPEGTRPFRDAA